MKQPYIKPILTHHGKLVEMTLGGSCLHDPNGPPPWANGNPNSPWFDDDCDDDSYDQHWR